MYTGPYLRLVKRLHELFERNKHVFLFNIINVIHEFHKNKFFNKNTSSFPGERKMVQERMYIFQERQNVLEQIKISRKFCKNTYDFPGEKNTIRTDQIFQETFLKICKNT